jgi:hypothetical protein
MELHKTTDNATNAIDEAIQISFASLFLPEFRVFNIL